MKKTYFKPEMEVLDMQYAQMIAASLPVFTDEITDASQIKSREENLFDFLSE